MTLNKRCPFLHQFLVLSAIVLAAFGCAVPQKPRGGPKDVTPPKLLKATPPNQTHNFSSKTIQLDFDEFFALSNTYQEINISPVQKNPDYKIKQKSLEITFKDTLKKNTTYVINFGKAIADLHEHNVVKNFTYVFSTGSHIDSLSISGNVINTLTQDREKDVTVMIFTLTEDSLLFRKKSPSIYTTTDTSGNFTLSNLHEGLYKLYALKGSSTKVYDNPKELIGIPGKIINLQNDTAGINLKLFQEIPTKFGFLEKKFGDDGRIILAFNKPLEKPNIQILYPEAQRVGNYIETSKTRDSIQLYVNNMDFDSLRVAVLDGAKPIDSVTLRKGRKETYIRNEFISTNADSRGLLKPGTDLVLISNSPISTYDPSLFTLNEDSTVLSNYTIKKDSANQKRLSINYKWRQGANYTLTLNEAAISGYFGEKNKRIIKRFKIEKPENYGQLTLSYVIPDTSKAYIVEVLTDQNILIQRTPITENTRLVFKALLAGKYKTRVVYDDNKNGKWDTGSVKENRQPENIWVDREILPVRANFENDVEITIPREPTP